MGTGDQDRGISRRRLLQAGTAIGLGAAAASTIAASPAAASGFTFHAAQANIRQRLPWADYNYDLDELMNEGIGGIDLLGINEAWKYPNEIAYVANHYGYHILQSTDHQAAATNALLARKSVFDVLEYSNLASVGNPGDTKPRPTYISRASYLVKPTGTILTHVHTHLQPKLERMGKPAPERPERVNSAKHQINQVRHLATEYRSYGHDVIVTGDFNVAYEHDRWDPETPNRQPEPGFPYDAFERNSSLVSCFTKHGIGQPDTRGTHQTEAGHWRWIDYIYQWQDGGFNGHGPTRLVMEAYSLAPKRNSDHHAVIARFRL